MPERLFDVKNCFKNSEGTFLKGCKWSPDGCCVLAASEDRKLRLFEIPYDCVTQPPDKELDAILAYNEGGTIYDYAWYPGMSSSDPLSCVFASSSKDSPIHLWDAFTGELRATYQPINQYDEVHSACSLAFSPDGKLYSGFNKEIKIFDLGLPGREFEKRSLKEDQPGIISAIAFNPVMPSLYALGSYNKSIGIYTEPKGDLLCSIIAHTGGVTHLMFSPDGTRLYSGARMDNVLYCWDLRNPGAFLFTIQREVKTCQRIYFDITSNGRFLVTGATNGMVSLFDLDGPLDGNACLGSKETWKAHEDCANGVSIHPTADIVATASGQRHIRLELSDDESEEDDDVIENNLSFWRVDLGSPPTLGSEMGAGEVVSIENHHEKTDDESDNQQQQCEEAEKIPERVNAIVEVESQGNSPKLLDERITIGDSDLELIEKLTEKPGYAVPASVGIDNPEIIMDTSSSTKDFSNEVG